MVELQPAEQPVEPVTPEEIGLWKGGWEHLRVIGRRGSVAIVWVPCGGEAYALWNILLPYAQGNARRKAAAGDGDR
jgi:hypothetical protein